MVGQIEVTSGGRRRAPLIKNLASCSAFVPAVCPPRINPNYEFREVRVHFAAPHVDLCGFDMSGTAINSGLGVAFAPHRPCRSALTCLLPCLTGCNGPVLVRHSRQTAICSRTRGQPRDGRIRNCDVYVLLGEFLSAMPKLCACASRWLARCMQSQSSPGLSARGVGGLTPPAPLACAHQSRSAI